MAVSSGIYANLKIADPMGSYQKGVESRMQREQFQQQQQDQQWKNEAQKAYGLGVVQNPDGSTSFDMNKVLAGSGDAVKTNPYLAKMSYEINQTMSQQQRDQAQRDIDNQLKSDANARAIEAQKADIALKNAQIGKMNYETTQLKSSPTARLTEAEKAVDKKYAETFNNLAGKGYNNAANSIQQLESLASELEKDNGIMQAGGGRASFLPDAFRDRDSIRYRDTAVNAANATLKEIFGAQLSDGERMSAAKEFYNDNLDNAENAKILRNKINLMRENLESESTRARFFEENKTLSGYKPISGKGELSESPKMSMQDKQALEWAKKNSQDPRAAQILKLNGKGG